MKSCRRASARSTAILAVRPADILSAQQSLALPGETPVCLTGKMPVLQRNPSQSRPVCPDKILQRIQLQRERDVTAITQQRHFKYSLKPQARDVINPLGKRVVVPHLPKKTAHQRAN